MTVVDDTAAPDNDLPVSPTNSWEHGGDCVCGEGWRFEFTDFHTGRVKAVAHPISVSWEDNYTSPGVGSMLIATRDHSADDVWPNTTGVYISRVLDDGSRVGAWGGFVESFNGSAGGATTLGLRSIDSYLFRRLIAQEDKGLRYTTTTVEGGEKLQTQIGADLVNIARPNGVPLIPEVGDGSRMQQRTWEAWEFKNIGEAVKELVETARGVRYHLVHEYGAGFWTTRIIFTDQWGTDRNLTLKGDREAWQYQLEVDGKDETSRAYGVGSGEEDQQQFSIAFDEDALLPELQDTPAWKDTKDPETLDKQTRGYISDHRDPVATPEVVIAGLEPDPQILLPGDTVNVDIGYGLITFNGQARVLSIAWRLEADAPPTRTVALLPTVRASQGIRTTVPAVAPSPTAPIGNQTPPPSSPYPPAGKLTTVKVAALDEISGIQGSRTYPNGVWVHNDEGETPQVYLIDKSTGNRVGSWTPDVPVLNDPEAIRMDLLTNTLWIADIGDGGSNVLPRRLVAVPEPGRGDKGVIAATSHDISYPGGTAYNAETLMISPTTGEMFVVTKETNGGRVFSFGTSPNPTAVGVQKASGLPANISDGDITRDGKFALFTTVGQSFVNVYSTSTWKKVGQIAVPAMAKCEAISILGPCHFVVTTEGVGAPIYQVQIPKAYGATCTKPTGGGGGGTGPVPPGNPVPGQVLNLTDWKLTLPI